MKGNLRHAKQREKNHSEFVIADEYLSNEKTFEILIRPRGWLEQVNIQ